MTYKMDRDKLEEITRIINREAQPTATEDEVWAYIANRLMMLTISYALVATEDEVWAYIANRPVQWLRDASEEEIAAWIIRDIWGEEE